MSLIERGPLMHQCPGCWSAGFHEPPEDGWIECDCGEKMDVIDLRAAEPRGAVERIEQLEAELERERTRGIDRELYEMVVAERDEALDRLRGR